MNTLSGLIGIVILVLTISGTWRSFLSLIWANRQCHKWCSLSLRACEALRWNWRLWSTRKSGSTFKSALTASVTWAGWASSSAAAISLTARIAVHNRSSSILSASKIVLLLALLNALYLTSSCSVMKPFLTIWFNERRFTPSWRTNRTLRSFVLLCGNLKCTVPRPVMGSLSSPTLTTRLPVSFDVGSEINRLIWLIMWAVAPLSPIQIFLRDWRVTRGSRGNIDSCIFSHFNNLSSVVECFCKHILETSKLR